MRRVGRRPFLLGSLLVAACRDGSIERPPKPSFDAGNSDASPGLVPFEAGPIYEVPTCVDRNPGAPLRALTGLFNARPHAPTLYSFTTAEQAAGLRRGDPVFSKATNDAGHRGYLFDELDARAKRNPPDPAAKLLTGPRFELGRFGWPFLAGSRISPEKYGDEILAFRFKAEAIFVDVGRRARYWCFDGAGAEVKTEVAMAAPERIAAFFFFNDSNMQYGTGGPDFRCRVPPVLPLMYREFYLGNPGMLAEWSLGTQAILDRLDAEIADLRSLANDLDCTRGRVGSTCEGVVATWASGGRTRADSFIASTAFASWFGSIGITGAEIARLADDLETLRFVPNPYIVTA